LVTVAAPQGEHEHRAEHTPKDERDAPRPPNPLERARPFHALSIVSWQRLRKSARFGLERFIIAPKPLDGAGIRLKVSSPTTLKKTPGFRTVPFRLIPLCVTLALGLAAGCSRADKAAQEAPRRGEMMFPVETLELRPQRVEYKISAVGSVEAF